MEQDDPDRSVASSSSQSVAQPHMDQPTSSHPPSPPVLDNLHRRLRKGVGGSHGQPHGSGEVAGSDPPQPHQQPRARSRLQRSGSIPVKSSRRTDPDQIGQQDSGGPHKQPGRHKGPIPVQKSRTNPPVGPLEGLVPHGKTQPEVQTSWRIS